MGELEKRIRDIILLRAGYKLKGLSAEEIDSYVTDKVHNIAETLVDQLEEIWGL